MSQDPERILQALSGNTGGNSHVVSATSVIDVPETPSVSWDDMVSSTRACITDVASEVFSGNNVAVLSANVRAGKSFIISRLVEHSHRFIKNIDGVDPVFIRVNSAAGNLGTPNSLFSEILNIAEQYDIEVDNTCVITDSIKTAYVLSSLNCSIILESELNDFASIRSENSEIFSSWHEIFVDDYEMGFNEICQSIFNIVAKRNNKKNKYQVTLADVQFFVNKMFIHCEQNIGIDPNTIPIGVYSVGFNRVNMIANMNYGEDTLNTIVRVMKDEDTYNRVLSFMGIDEDSFSGNDGIDGLMDAIKEAVGGGMGSPDGVTRIAFLSDASKMDGDSGEDSDKKKPSALRFRKPSQLEHDLHNKIFGQDSALEDVVDSLMIPASKLNAENKPLRSMMFVGPTGVGKTETALTIAEKLCTKKLNVIRLDMSEYMEQHSVNKLFGAPPSYVGFESGGKLTGEVMKNPQSVIILDEIEKAHDRVFDAFLQVLDAGRMTTGQGEEVDFSQCVIIMTSNAGAFESSRNVAGFGNGTLSTNESHSVIRRELERKFRPEFLNRIDTFVYFDGLSDENIIKIVNNEISGLSSKLKRKHKVELEFADNEPIERYLMEKIDPKKYGAREVQRVISRELINPVSRTILENSTKDKKRVVIDLDDTNKIVATLEK